MTKKDRVSIIYGTKKNWIITFSAFGVFTVGLIIMSVMVKILCLIFVAFMLIIISYFLFVYPVFVVMDDIYIRETAFLFRTSKKWKWTDLVMINYRPLHGDTDRIDDDNYYGMNCFVLCFSNKLPSYRVYNEVFNDKTAILFEHTINSKKLLDKYLEKLKERTECTLKYDPAGDLVTIVKKEDHDNSPKQ